MSAPLVLSVRETSELLGLSVRSTYRRCASRELPAFRLGGRLLILRPLLELEIAEQVTGDAITCAEKIRDYLEGNGCDCRT